MMLNLSTARKYVFIFSLLLPFFTMGLPENHHMVIVVRSYNNKDYYRKNLDSLVSQNYSNYSILYIDDRSSDGTGALVEQYISENNIQNIVLIKKLVRGGALCNLYIAAHHYCNDNDIIVLCDGDDQLIDKNALSIINNAYNTNNVFMTYGNFSGTRNGIADWCRPIEQYVINKHAYRKNWFTGHPRTFYAWIFKHIKLEDMLHEGVFFQMAEDQAWANPILEMTQGKAKFIPNVLYIYNEDNPIAEGSRIQLQHKTRDIIRSKKPYTPLQRLEPMLIPPTTTCKTIISRDNPNQLEMLLHKQSDTKFILWSASESYQNTYEQLMQQYPNVIFIKSELAKTLFEHEIFKKYDMCLFVSDTAVSLQFVDVQKYSHLLQATQATLAIISKYNGYTENKSLQHCAYLWDTLFAFQFGWKPHLPFAHNEQAWLVPTKTCIEYSTYIKALIEERTAFTQQPSILKNKAGLLVIL